MRKEKALIALLRGLVDLLTEESNRNPEFARKLDILLSELPERKKAPKPKTPPTKYPLDVYAEWKARGETEFCLWLRDQPIPALRAVIRKEDLDPTRRTSKWKEAEKLAKYITDRLGDRMQRGEGFIGRSAND